MRRSRGFHPCKSSDAAWRKSSALGRCKILLFTFHSQKLLPVDRPAKIKNRRTVTGNIHSLTSTTSPHSHFMVEYERTQDREPTDAPSHKICVVGIGSGGLNVLDRICLDRLMEATLVSMHTDVRVLSHSMGP